MDHLECIVVGADVVGLAVARALAAAGRQTLVLEAEDTFGTATSSRNSEVIHAGLYYPTDSLKARLCVAGRRMLYDCCESRRIDLRNRRPPLDAGTARRPGSRGRYGGLRIAARARTPARG